MVRLIDCIRLNNIGPTSPFTSPGENWLQRVMLAGPQLPQGHYGQAQLSTKLGGMIRPLVSEKAIS